MTESENRLMDACQSAIKSQMYHHAILFWWNVIVTVALIVIIYTLVHND